MMGPLIDEHYNHLPAVTWYEKTGILLLLIPIIGMGVAPLWLSEMIMASLQPFIKGVL